MRITSAGERRTRRTAREVERLAAGLKAFTTWNTTRTLQTCREACGGEGYISANRLPALKDDTDIFTTFEGDNTVLMLWVGRNLLAMPTPSEPVDATHGDFRSWFVRREQTILEEIRAKLAQLAQEGVDPHVAAARQQTALFHAAQAYAERVVLEAFEAGIRQNADESLHEVLRQIRDLFALALMEQHRGWYLENGMLTPARSKGLAETIDRLCADLAPDAPALVEAFGIPAQCLSAPIAE